MPLPIKINNMYGFANIELNGGKGSGNFGHAGRPGEIGGSAPQGVVSEARGRAIRIGDFVEGKDVDGNSCSGIVTNFPDKIVSIKHPTPFDPDHEINASVMEITDKDGKTREIPMFQPYIRNIRRADAPTDTPAERRTQKQKEALDEVFNLIECSATDKKYFYNNMSEHTAVALKDELAKAGKAYGIDLSDFTLGKFNGKRAQARVVWQKNSRRDGLVKTQLQLSNALVADGENYRKRNEQCAKDFWHTSGDIAGLIRHELGHMKVYQIAKDNGKQMYRESDYGYGLRFNQLAYSNTEYQIVKQALGGHIRYSKSKKGSKGDISEYGGTNIGEAIAESFSNPNFSDFTKKVYDTMMSKDFKLQHNEVDEKVLNSVDETPENSLCSGYPLTKEDWEIMTGQRKEEKREIKL